MTVRTGLLLLLLVVQLCSQYLQFVLQLLLLALSLLFHFLQLLFGLICSYAAKRVDAPLATSDNNS